MCCRFPGAPARLLELFEAAGLHCCQLGRDASLDFVGFPRNVGGEAALWLIPDMLPCCFCPRDMCHSPYLSYGTGWEGWPSLRKGAQFCTRVQLKV